MVKCDDCFYYRFEDQFCRRYPQLLEKAPLDWCGEYKTKGVKENVKKKRKVKSDNAPTARTGRNIIAPQSDRLSLSSSRYGGQDRNKQRGGNY